MNDTRAQLPIGYWMKQADNLLTMYSNKVQAENGVTRFEWQTLNLLSEHAGAVKEEISHIMQEFVDTATLDLILQRFVDNGWIACREIDDTTSTYQLTDEGRLHHMAVLESQQGARQVAMRGISEEEYVTAVHVLQRIVENLEHEHVHTHP